MKNDVFGWCGKILHVDLGNSEISELDTMDYADRSEFCKKSETLGSLGLDDLAEELKQKG